MAAKFLWLRHSAEGDEQPGRRGDAGEVRLWPFGAALGVAFTAAVLGLAGLTWLAWALLGHPRLPRPSTITLHNTVGVLQLVFASIAGAEFSRQIALAPRR